MLRRNFIKGFVALGVCPLCARAALADAHWGYAGEDGPDHWSELAEEDRICAAGDQQSPIDITGTLKADLRPISVGWQPGKGTMVNNGHTIQIDMPEGGRLSRGDREYELQQFHFHAPSEHHVAGRSFPMEAHFVQKDPRSNALGVLGVFLVPGARNDQFAALAAAFPSKAGENAPLERVDAGRLLPSSLRYWVYEGSLTTPPCSEVVDWMIAMDPVEVDPADIARFTALYPMNARPIRPVNRRFILGAT